MEITRPIPRLFTYDDLRATLEVYLEYINVHGYESEDAVFAALDEACQGYDASVELYDAGEIRNLPDGEIALRALFPGEDHD